MFRIHIFESDQKIQIHGDANLIQEIRQSMHKWDFTSNYSEYLNVDKNGNKSNYALLRFGIWHLKIRIDGQSIADIFLNFIKNKQIAIDNRADYFLTYWALEARMIESNQSYRSRIHPVLRMLTSPETLNAVLNLCQKKFPLVDDLFTLIENSEAMKQHAGAVQPVTPTVSEIKLFLIKNNIPVKPSQRKVPVTDGYGNILGFRLFSGLNNTAEKEDSRRDEFQLKRTTDCVQSRKRRV